MENNDFGRKVGNVVVGAFGLFIIAILGACVYRLCRMIAGF